MGSARRRPQTSPRHCQVDFAATGLRTLEPPLLPHVSHHPDPARRPRTHALECLLLRGLEGRARDHRVVPSERFEDPRIVHTLDDVNLHQTDITWEGLRTAGQSYNSFEKAFSTNVRFNLIHRPGSDFFIVFTENRGDDRRVWSLSDRGMVMKITYLARIVGAAGPPIARGTSQPLYRLSEVMRTSPNPASEDVDFFDISGIPRRYTFYPTPPTLLDFLLRCLLNGP